MTTTCVAEDSFGRFTPPNGPSEPVRRFTLTNSQGSSAQVITYGATLTSLNIPDKNGQLGDVVLGFDSLDDYRNHRFYFGATIGRVANRIANGKFQLENKLYYLATNNGPNHLHGGLVGYDKVLWDSHVEGNSVTFSYSSPDRDEGYPGMTLNHVCYKLTDDNELVITYRATANKPTPLNLTNHSYFNLGGHASGAIDDHLVQINAAQYLPVSEALIPTGELAPVNGTVFDLRTPVRLGNVLSSVPGGGFDHNFCVNPELQPRKEIAQVKHVPSGRVMTVYTTKPGVQFYTGNFLPQDDSCKGKSATIYRKQGGFCLETQYYPNSVNEPSFPSSVILPGHVYTHSTIYKFSTEYLD